MSTCAICLSPAPAGYDQCRDCIATFGVKENPAKFAKERLNPPKSPINERRQSSEKVDILEKQGDVEGLLKLHQEQETKRMTKLSKEARDNLRRAYQSRMRLVRVFRNKLLRAPKYVWVLLAVYLGCAAAEHLTMAGAYALDLHARITKGSRAP